MPCWPSCVLSPFGVFPCWLVGGWCLVLLPVISAVLCWSVLFLSVSAARCDPLVACVVAPVPVWPRGPLCRCVLWIVVVRC